MKTRFWLALGVLAVLALALAACGGKATPTAEEHTAGESASTETHTEAQPHEDEHEHMEAPEPYASMTNPFAGDPQAIEAGRELYQVNCATCHGPEGKGDGPAAAALPVQPANLADAEMMAEASDGFLYWRISQGMMSPGMEKSGMPAFGHMLSEEQIWQIISYVRTLSEPAH